MMFDLNVHKFDISGENFAAHSTFGFVNQELTWF